MGIFDTPRSVCLLRSRRRTFLFGNVCFYLNLDNDIGGLLSLKKTKQKDSNSEREAVDSTVSFKLSAVNSEPSGWQEEIVLNWNQVIVRDDLLGLRKFFKQGMTVNVVEEKVCELWGNQY